MEQQQKQQLDPTKDILITPEFFQFLENYANVVTDELISFVNPAVVTVEEKLNYFKKSDHTPLKGKRPKQEILDRDYYLGPDLNKTKDALEKESRRPMKVTQGIEMAREMSAYMHGIVKYNEEQGNNIFLPSDSDINNLEVVTEEEE